MAEEEDEGGGEGRGQCPGGKNSRLATPRQRRTAGGGRQDAASSSEERHVDPVEFRHAVPEPASQHKRGRRRRQRQRRGRRTGRREQRDGGAPPLATAASATDLLPWPVANHKYLRFSISLSISLTIPSKIVPKRKGQTLKFFN
jgi:hypothetical protein